MPVLLTSEPRIGKTNRRLAQLQSSKLQLKTKRITSNNPRIQAQVLQFPNISLLWVNTYFPTDPQTNLFKDNELREVLRDMETIMDTIPIPTKKIFI